MRHHWILVLPMTVFCWACSGPEAELDVPVARLATPEALERGRSSFLTYCSLCHGERGDGEGVRRADLSTRPRDLMGPAWRASVSAAEVFRTLRDGVQGTSMPSWRALPEEERWDLTAYVLSLAGTGGG